MITSMTRKMIIPLVRGEAVVPVMITFLPVLPAHVGVVAMEVHRQTGLFQGSKRMKGPKGVTTVLIGLEQLSLGNDCYHIERSQS